ncbi:MAG: hypothetical protein WC378_00055 [Opitutaceae bacterium]|jgi:hypothetical protein
MATDLENAVARRTAIMTELAALSTSAAGGRPNISGGGGGTVDHVGYKDGLYRELKELSALIDVLAGPWEVPLEGRPA